MLYSALFSAALVLTCAAAPAAAMAPQANQARVRIDSARHTVVLTMGPWHVAPNPEGYAASGHSHQHDQPALQEFVWPVNGWVRGFKLRVLDSRGKELSRQLIHHLGVANFARRQLVLAAPERLLAIGQETADARLPASIGIPVSAGMPMGITFAWFNGGKEMIHDASIELIIEWTPSNQMPRPVSVLPVAVSVIKEVGVPSGFDIPPGMSSWSASFNLPVTGRILGAGAHLHDHGVDVTLQDIAGQSPKTLLTLAAERSAAGQVLGMERALPGVSGNGIAMKAERTYSITGRYLNPNAQPLAKHAMVSLGLLFAPDRIDQLPPVDPAHSDWKKDLRYLGKRE